MNNRGFLAAIVVVIVLGIFILVIFRAADESPTEEFTEGAGEVTQELGEEAEQLGEQAQDF